MSTTKAAQAKMHDVQKTLQTLADQVHDLSNLVPQKTSALELMASGALDVISASSEVACEIAVQLLVEEVTPNRIEALLVEARDAGDEAQVERCTKALRGDRAALEQVASVLGAARKDG
ncbi:MAG: hypothetical protein ACRD68_09675 [Pyrinomonadaceae bacterium]